MTDQSKYKKILNVTCLSIMMIDSGGGLGIRNLAFLIIFFFAILGISQYKTINKNFLYIYLLFLLSLIPSILISIFSGVSASEILLWITSFLLMPLFYFYTKGSDLSSDSFVNAGLIFSLLVIMIFFGRLFNFGLIVILNDFIRSRSSGFFGDKNFLSGAILPNVYFQGTLSLIICGGLSLRKKSYLAFFIMLVAIVLAPSRFGFLVLIFWAGFLFFKKSILRLGLFPLIAISIFIILQNLPFGKELFSVFSGESDALEIRNGHFRSVCEIFYGNPLYFFFGQGPGTFFFSKGFYELTDNIEISQLEYIRKYGILSFLIFCLLYFLPLFSRLKFDIYIKGTLVLYFLVSFSNPVLSSIFSMIFLSFAYKEIFDNKTNQFSNITNYE